MAEVKSIAEVEARLRTQIHGPCPEWLGSGLRDMKAALAVLRAVRPLLEKHRNWINSISADDDAIQVELDDDLATLDALLAPSGKGEGA